MLFYLFDPPIVVCVLQDFVNGIEESNLSKFCVLKILDVKEKKNERGHRKEVVKNLLFLRDAIIELVRMVIRLFLLIAFYFKEDLFLLNYHFSVCFLELFDLANQQHIYLPNHYKAKQKSSFWMLRLKSNNLVVKVTCAKTNSGNL